MDIPRIRVEAIDDICVLICHLIYSLGCPLSKNQLIEITSLEDAVNYFGLMKALDKANGHLLSAIEADDEIIYSNTDFGIKAARELGSSVPLSVRDKMFQEAIRVYTRDAMKKKGTMTAIRYVVNPDGTCTIGVRITDEETTKQKYFIEMNADNPEKADYIKNKIKNNPHDFTKYLDDYFSK
ncbi:MAG: DUF4364 family protein [Oscillospiraceae bacterium]|nr:DUF4364 family protein [Oscillospiraceae bacterium]